MTMDRGIDDRSKLGSGANAAIDVELRPGESIRLAIGGSHGADLAVSDTRLFLWKQKALRIFSLESIDSLRWSTGVMPWVQLVGEGFDPTPPRMTNLLKHPSAFALNTSFVVAERHRLEELLAAA